MSHYGSLAGQPELSISQILQEAQHRWLRPIEVCEILKNFRKFKLEQEPPLKPQGGSLFLFDRKALRYFRKDGHNWRKKKDGKTVREAHERLKAGSIEVLHCYYAHGEDDENFQRRSYWMLERDLEHIVFVHYRQVKEGNRGNLMCSLNDYHVDSPSTSQELAGIASPSPQTSPVLSPQAFSPTSSPNASETNGHIFSIRCDHDSSDDVEQCLPLNLELPSDRYHEGTSFRVIETNLLESVRQSKLKSALGCAQPTVPLKGRGLSLAVTSGLPPMQGNGSQGKVEATDRDYHYDGQSVPVSSGFELLDWGDRAKNLVSMGMLAGFERQEVCLPSLTHLLDQYPTLQQHSQPVIGGSNLKTPMMEPTEGLFYPGMGMETLKQPITAMQCQGLSLSETFKANTKKGGQQHSSAFPQQLVVDGHGDDVHGQSEPGNVLGYERLTWTQNKEFQRNIHQDYLQQLDVSDQQASQQQHGTSVQSEPSRSNASNIKDISQSPAYSHVFKDFQADSPFQQEEQEHLKKLDSFGRWINQEIAAGSDNSLLSVSSDSSSYWAGAFGGKITTDEAFSLSQGMHLDVGLSLSVFQKQCFSIVDFSPDHGFSSEETKVLITGTLLDIGKDLTRYQWCCMFGDEEVPAELVFPGVLRTKAPPHSPGRVPFYITQGDRVPCSEIKEFRYHADSNGYTKNSTLVDEMLLQIRLARSLSSTRGVSVSQVDSPEISPGVTRLNLASVGISDEWEQLEKLSVDGNHLILNVKDRLLQNLLQQKLQDLQLCNALKGHGFALDVDGLGILHMGAALGYDWIVEPLLSCGLNVNFRDARGWTALHWAAFCGRERTVVTLLAAGADPGAKTDPTPSFPAGQTPADLASSRWHKGIAGYLAESSLTNHLSLLTLQDCKMGNFSAALADQKAVQTMDERMSVKLGLSGSEDQLSLQDSLAAVRNATLAVARIQATFRAFSFRKKQEADKQKKDEYGISGEQFLSIIAAKKPHKSIQNSGEELHSAAICIQQKFRAWKGRKDFLLFRQHVVKIQAHVRGHQVRKNYKKIVWSVGIVEKAILRWRRKGRGLRGFYQVTPLQNKNEYTVSNSDGDSDFLKVGRKQTEAGLEKALARVQSMVKSPEARDQYRRLLDSFQKAKAQLGGGRSCNDNSCSKEDLVTGDDYQMSM